jgi:hypothetical protein
MKKEERIQELLKQTEKVADAHRQFYNIHFQDNSMDFAFQWALGTIRNGGGEIGEMFYTASQIEDFNPDSWAEEWPKIAEKVEKRAQDAAAKKHFVSAREFYMRSATYYRTTLATLLPSDPKFKMYAEKFKACFLKAAPMYELPIEYIEIPFENTLLPGCFIKSSAEDKKNKTLIMIGGGETFFMDLYMYIAPSALKRGYNFLTVDIPGQGTLPFEGHVFRPDTEIPIKAIIDYALNRPDVDPDKLAMYGISGGGYYVPRAAAYDKRIKACIANHVFNDFNKFLSHTALKTKKDTEKISPMNYRMMELLSWRHGLKSISAIIERSKAFKFDPSMITCPFLNITSSGEYANPATKAIQDECFKNIGSNVKNMIVAPFNEGAGTHCLGENLGLMSALVFDWLDEVFY